MPPTTALYSIRLGRASDVPAATSLLCSAFANDSLLDILYPTRHEHPADFQTSVYRLFHARYWTPGYSLSMLVDDSDGGRPVGFAWWRRPLEQLSFYERWLSPCKLTLPGAMKKDHTDKLLQDAWFAPIMRAFISLHARLRPLPSIKENAGAYQRVFAEIQPRILNTQHRREAWYLSTLAVEPKLQGHGLGTKLIGDGMAKAKAQGRAVWLVGLSGTDSFYSRHGFVEAARANVGELESWDGGVVMFAD